LPKIRKKNLSDIEDLHPELDEYLFGAENAKRNDQKI
jgi:hypothetical protein